MQISENEAIKTELLFIRGYIEIGKTEEAIKRIDTAIERHNAWLTQHNEGKAVIALKNGVEQQTKIRNSCLQCGNLRDAAYHDEIAKAYAAAINIIENQANDEFPIYLNKEG